MVRLDSAILHAIVRHIEEKEKVPERVRVRSRQYQITYLDDHRQRLEDAIQRRDPDRLNMLFGQLPGRIKYQQLRPARPAARKVPPKPAHRSAKSPAKRPIRTAARRRVRGR